MRNVRWHLILCPILSLAFSAAWADSVVVNTSLGLSSLQINPATGTLEILPSTTPSTYAQALDSLGGYDAESSGTSTSASTTLANGTGMASGSALTGSVSANVNLPDGFTGFSSSSGDATLVGQFEITGTTNPVNVTFGAPLSMNQFLQTSGSGVYASSETIFALLLPDISSSPLLFGDNLLTIGPGQTLSFSDNPTLSISMSLMPNTPYSFVASLDAESYGASVVPEPSPLLLLLTASGLLVLSGKRFIPKSHLKARS